MRDENGAVKGEGTGRSDFGLGIIGDPLPGLSHLLLHFPFHGLAQEQVHHRLSHVGASVHQNQLRFQEQMKLFGEDWEKRGTYGRGRGSVSLKLPAPTMRCICITEGFGGSFGTLFRREKRFVGRDSESESVIWGMFPLPTVGLDTLHTQNMLPSFNFSPKVIYKIRIRPRHPQNISYVTSHTQR